jgi:Zn ribbon nucleic-acid-binding protein
MNMHTMSMMRKDFVASNLRSQVTRLQNVLDNIEEVNKVECGFAEGSLKEVETSLRSIRKMCTNG